MAPNEKAAWWRLNENQQREFWRQLFVYAVFITAIGIVRTLIGQLNGFMGFIAWEAVYIPLCVVLALVLAYRTKD